jgi:hypothetical protein
MRRLGEALTALLVVGAVLFGVPLIVIASGQTFDQRCGRIYTGAAHERCVMRLSTGDALYEESARQ